MSAPVSAPGPSSGAAARGGLRGLDRTRVGILLVASVLVVAAVVTGLRLFTHDKPTHVEAVFSSTVGLYPGSDVRVLGVSVGSVTSVKPHGTDVVVGLDIDADQRISSDTGAVVIAPSLVSDRFVQLTKPWNGGATLHDGATIPESRTAVPVELDQLYTSLDDLVKALGPDGANSKGALSQLLKTGAANLKGNGADINKLLKQVGAATGTLSGSDQDLFKTVDNLDQFNQVLVANDNAVGQVNSQLATVSQYLADDRGDLATAVQTLGSSLTQVEGFIRDNRAHLRSSVRQLTGTTKLLHRQRKDLESVLRTLPGTLQDFLRAFDPTTGSLVGRVDLNELSIWAQSVGGQQPATGGTSGGTSGGSTTDGSATQGPPLLLPSVGDEQ